jgi:hypothetical protein
LGMKVHSSIAEEIASHPYLKNFGANSKFHSLVVDPKHHLDHAHEHLAKAKEHHTALLGAEHPHEVLHHSKKRNQHAKWAEKHLQHFHGLTNNGQVASVEETAAKGLEFGKNWSAHAAYNNWNHHLRQAERHSAANYKAEQKGDLKKADLHQKWADAHNHKAAKLDPFLDHAGKGRIKKPRDLASVEEKNI